MKKEIDNFFVNIKKILSDDISEPITTCEAPIKKDTAIRTNVIYLTTDCNLRCEYCYEKDGRETLDKQKDCEINDIDVFVDEIYEREYNNNSCIVVFGGEPLLRIDLLEYLCNRLCEKSKKNGWAINLITNGTLFNGKNLEKIIRIKDICDANGIHFAIDVSYDASGQYRRKFPNGSSSKDIVEKTILKFIEFKIPFRISYTVHSGNYLNMTEDIIYIIETYNPERISLSFAYQDLDKILGENQCFKVPSDFKPYADYIFSIYKVPLCAVTCSVCKKCNKTCAGNAYYSPTSGMTYQDKSTRKKFNGFNESI